MSAPDDQLRIRPGRIHDGGRAAPKPKSFVDQVMRATKKAGHSGSRFGSANSASASRFGRGRSAAVAASLRSPHRRVVIKACVVRHKGQRFRSAPMHTHLSYLKRDGVTRSREPAAMFDANGDQVDERAFAARCEADRHHFRFIVSPEDAADLADLRATTRELMAQAERDLGTRLEWVAVVHWNTDNPHVHVLVRGRADDGADLVIGRDYISRGLRGRAEAIVDMELGPRSEQAVRRSLESEVRAERWTGLDRALQVAADEGGGVADLRPGSPGAADPELRRLMIGRAQTLERLGLAEQVDVARWTLRPGAEATLRDLAIRGDVIKTMHRALARSGREPSVADFAIHGYDAPGVLGRLADRGLYDELAGSAYVVVEGVDGRSHHLRFRDLEATGDAPIGAVVEARSFEASDGQWRLTLSVRSDLPIESQVTSPGATWLDRQLVGREPPARAGKGFGEEVRAALEQRADHLAAEGLARRQAQRTLFARDLLDTLRDREIAAAASRISAASGLPFRPSGEGEPITGTYRERVTLASGRFAMIDNGLGFELVPWKPALERQLGRQVQGMMLPGGGVDWSLGRSRGPSL